MAGGQLVQYLGYGVISIYLREHILYQRTHSTSENAFYPISRLRGNLYISIRLYVYMSIHIAIHIDIQTYRYIDITP